LLVREAQHRIALRSEPRIAFRVAILTRCEVVTLAIDLNNHTRRMAYEIRDEISDRRLPAKTKSVDIVSFEISPQQRLRARHRLSQLFRAAVLNSADLCMRHGRDPSP
jgi:hypothetical protein